MQDSVGNDVELQELLQSLLAERREEEMFQSRGQPRECLIGWRENRNRSSALSGTILATVEIHF